MRKIPSLRIVVFTACLLLCWMSTGCGLHCCDGKYGPVAEWPEVYVEPESALEVPTQEKVEKLVSTPAPEEVDVASEPIEYVAPVTPPPTRVPEPVDSPAAPGSILAGAFEDVPSEALDLEGKIEGKQEAYIDEEYILQYTVFNKGAVAAEQYEFTFVIPQGWRFRDNPGSNRWTQRSVGPLAAGSGQPYEIVIFPTSAGTHDIRAELTATGVSHPSRWNVQVYGRPQLAFDLEGPSKVPMGRPCTYKITVRNVGTGPMLGVTLQGKFNPQQLMYEGSEPEGSYNEEKGVITWELGDIAPNGTKECTLAGLPISSDDLKIVMQARVKNKDKSIQDSKEVITEVVAEIGLNLRQYDSQDPLTPGENTTYVVDVENNGYRDATSLQMTDTIPKNAVFQKATSRTPVGMPLNYELKEQDGRVLVVFDELDFLPPGEKVTFEVTVQMPRTGDYKNRVQISCNEFGTPVMTEEGTKVQALDEFSEEDSNFGTPDAPKIPATGTTGTTESTGTEGATGTTGTEFEFDFGTEGTTGTTGTTGTEGTTGSTGMEFNFESEGETVDESESEGEAGAETEWNFDFDAE